MGKIKFTLQFSLALTLLLFAINLYAAGFFEEGIAEFKAENYEEALDLFKKAREKQPESSVAAFYLGLTYKQIGEYREAAKNFKDAISLTPPVKDAYTELIEMLYNLDELKEAKEWIERAEREGIKPAHIAFLKGMVLLKEDRARDAIDAFKRAKELDKTLTQAADFQIAMAYAKGRRLLEAKNALKAVMAIDPTTELAAFAREYERTLARIIEAYRPWRFTAGVAYTYDDNVVAKPSTEITGVEITGEKDHSGVGTFSINYTPLLSGPWSFTGQYSLYTNTYETTNTHNLINQSVSFIPGYSFENGVVTLPLGYNHIWLKEREYMSLILARPTLNIMLLPGHIGQFSIGYAKREMLQSPLLDDEDRDGDVCSISAGYLYPFSDGRGMLNLRYEFSRDITDGRNWENDVNRITLGLLIPLSDKINLPISGDVLLQDYKNTHTAFGIERRDKIYSGSAGITYEILKGLNLNLQYSHTRADSNIAIYDYKRNVYMAGIEYRF